MLWQVSLLHKTAPDVPETEMFESSGLAIEWICKQESVTLKDLPIWAAKEWMFVEYPERIYRIEQIHFFSDVGIYMFFTMKHDESESLMMKVSEQEAIPVAGHFADEWVAFDGHDGPVIVDEKHVVGRAHLDRITMV